VRDEFLKCLGSFKGDDDRQENGNFDAELWQFLRELSVEKLQEKLPLLSAFIFEVVRPYYAIMMSSPRAITQSGIVLRLFKFPRNMEVRLDFRSANRNKFPWGHDTLEFKPD